MKLPLSEDMTKRYLRLNALRKALDSTLRVQMERSMELYADLEQDFNRMWEDFTRETPLEIGKAWEIATDDGVLFYVRERKVQRRDSARDE